jgi:anionic cell wall polymer biosynthesis LytR-Cps2A-Psr (LCP) family protein
VVSIDPVTKQVAMFSLPRDTVDIPLPPGPLRNAYSRGVYPKKINALFTSVRNRPDLVPGNNRTRGYNGLKEVLGYVYGSTSSTSSRSTSTASSRSSTPWAG